jgi:hypothetical protein
MDEYTEEELACLPVAVKIVVSIVLVLAVILGMIIDFSTTLFVEILSAFRAAYLISASNIETATFILKSMWERP